MSEQDLHRWEGEGGAVAANEERAAADRLLAFRAKVLALCQNPYQDAVGAFAGDEPFAVGRKIAEAVMGLPLEGTP